MKKDGKKSPLRRPPLRQAGQSVQEEMERLWDDKIEYYLLAVSMLITLAVMDWLFWLFKQPRRPWLITVFAGVYFVYAVFRTRPLLKKYRTLKLGRDGERVMGQELEKLRAYGYRIYHDFLGDNFNVDHIVIGPTGVFTINTKTISMPSNSREPIDYDGDAIKVPGTKFDRDPIAYAKGERDFVRKWIQDNANRSVPVRPAIVFVGWKTTKRPEGAEVWVLNIGGLMSFIQNERSELSQDDIVHICGIFEAHIIQKQKNIAGESKYTTWSQE